jgi:hypothetical protein
MIMQLIYFALSLMPDKARVFATHLWNGLMYFMVAYTLLYFVVAVLSGLAKGKFKA